MPDDSAPRPISEDVIRRLTTAAEHQNGVVVTDIMNDIPPPQWGDVLSRMQNQNDLDRNAKTTPDHNELPHLLITDTITSRIDPDVSLPIHAIAISGLYGNTELVNRGGLYNNSGDYSSKSGDWNHLTTLPIATLERTLAPLAVLKALKRNGGEHG